MNQFPRDASQSDWEWLVSEEALPWLQQSREREPSLQTLTFLRRHLSPTRAALVVEQIELRRRAVKKFTRASEMFFTRRGLEQATDERIATYKAQRLAAPLIVDACCGIGGDLLALATRAEMTVAVDRSDRITLLAQANARVHGLEKIQFQIKDVQELDLLPEAQLHIDPDRRSGERRVSQVAGFEPSAELIGKLVGKAAAAAVKLAPATAAPEDWAAAGEREWIESDGQCRQQVLWCGEIVTAAGHRAATLVDANGQSLATFAAREQVRPEICSQLPAYVYDPAPSLVAAGLVDNLAQSLGLERATACCAYLASDQLIRHPLMTPFRVEDVLPFDRKRIKRYLRERAIGQLEIKQRGIDVRPEELVRQWGGHGSGRATLLVMRDLRNVVAIVAQRCAAAVDAI